MSATGEVGRHEEALPLFQRVGEAGDPDAWLGLGNSLQALDRPAEAAEAFRAAAAGGVDAAVLNLGLALEDLQDWAGARAAYERAREVGDPRAVMLLGRLRRHRGEVDAARDLLLAAARDGDAHAAAELGLWWVTDTGPAGVRSAGQQRSAHGSSSVAGLDAVAGEALLRQGADVDEDARCELAWLLRRRGDVDEAEHLLRAGARSGHVDAAIRLALLLEEDRGDLAGAEEVLRASAEGGELFAWNNLGLVLEARGRLVEAQEVLRRGARGGDSMAAANLRRLEVEHRRQLGRAHRVESREVRRRAGEQSD